MVKARPTKSQEIMEKLDMEEIQILLLCFSKPNVVEAMRIFHTIPGHGKKRFYDEGKKQMRIKLEPDIKYIGDE